MVLGVNVKFKGVILLNSVSSVVEDEEFVVVLLFTVFLVPHVESWFI